MLNDSTTEIIYLSGAGLDASIWDGIRKTVPGQVLGHSHDAHTSLQDVIDDSLRQITATSAERFVIVAHSLGGVIGVELARKLGDKLAGFIAVSATIPAPGKSFVATFPFPQNLIMPVMLKIAGTKPPVSMIKSGLCNDLNDSQTKAVVTNFAAEPLGLYTGKTSSIPLPASKYLYIKTLQDKQTKPATQNIMAKRLPHTDIKDIDAGHLSMISRPTELAAIIRSFTQNL